MALCIDYNKQTIFKSENGESITQTKNYPSAYVRIDEIIGDKATITLIVNVYESKPTIKADDEGVEYEESNRLDELFFNFAPSVADGSSNFIKQGYEYLKTTDIFANATDC